MGNLASRMDSPPTPLGDCTYNLSRCTYGRVNRVLVGSLCAKMVVYPPPTLCLKVMSPVRVQQSLTFICNGRKMDSV